MSKLPTLHSPLLSALPGVKHAFFTRQGGASRGVYDSLNIGRGSKDEPTDVEENRRRVADWFGLMPDALNTCYQIHSAKAVAAEAPWGAYRPQADGVVTNWPSIACGALAADCAPVLLADAEARVVGACHAGWQGALGGIVAGTVEQMARLGANPARIVAAVGPCIGQASYEVGLEFLERFEGERPGSAKFFAPGQAVDKRQFDLPGFVLERLAEAGVAQAEWVGRDTCAEPDWFFSNRRAFKQGEPDYGRLVSAIMLT
ncbi:peptidoglycan editing factor PgeF [Caulobacter mirabilis]|uniref:Purine nucleoside phosphorylase n=1 Tax=Caulobacter mirabilis TaxID=69666 RepID=A0A2D2B1E2_9CAUL|nr:peptidoglycan editing factor PgeF [Caulobacter mirabilis]ATQ44094.1 polyphenol oxidase [Caulobacter mirabilis]